MPKLPSSWEIETVLKQSGFVLVSLKHPSGKIGILPMARKEIPWGTFRSILRQTGISQEEFQKIPKG